MGSTHAPPRAAALVSPLSISDAEFHRFRALVHAETGIALSESKRPMVTSRLSRRLRFWGYTTFGEYWEHLHRWDPGGDELVRLINAMTTNKTDFFREAGHFECLRSTVLPALAARRGPRRLRIWSAGCSSGQEAYSIAATVLAGLTRPAGWDIRILASDIDTDVLAAGEAAVYPVDGTASVPAALRPQLFEASRSGRTVRVRDAVRQLVVFRRINLCAGPWPIRTLFDCIFCRNVVIYFDKDLQTRLVGRLAEYLQPGGYLFLGHSESLFGVRAGLHHVANTVYRKPEAKADGGKGRA
jgi:chemotaxis protein methyltransferase CheR